MGLLSLSVVAYTNKSGQLVIDMWVLPFNIILFRSKIISHDEIANVLGITSKSFEDTYEDKAKELKRTLLEYVKTLTAVMNSAGAVASATPAPGSIHFDPSGFPIAPNVLSGTTTKENLEQLYHAYITQHYHECLLPTAELFLTYVQQDLLAEIGNELLLSQG